MILAEQYNITYFSYQSQIVHINLLSTQQLLDHSPNKVYHNVTHATLKQQHYLKQTKYYKYCNPLPTQWGLITLNIHTQRLTTVTIRCVLKIKVHNVTKCRCHLKCMYIHYNIQLTLSVWLVSSLDLSRSLSGLVWSKGSPGRSVCC